MRVLYTTLAGCVAAIIVTVIVLTRFDGLALLNHTLTTMHARTGTGLVLALTIFALVRIVRYQFVLYREDVEIGHVATLFSITMPGNDHATLKARFRELVGGGLNLKSSLLAGMLREEIRRQQTIRWVKSSDRFETETFVSTYHLSLAQHRDRLEDTRVLILSICIAYTVIGLFLLLSGSKIPQTPEEIQAYMAHALGGVQVVFIVSAWGLPAVAVLYLVGAKTREWEQRIVARLERLVYASLSPLFNQPTYPDDGIPTTGAGPAPVSDAALPPKSDRRSTARHPDPLTTGAG